MRNSLCFLLLLLVTSPYAFAAPSPQLVTKEDAKQLAEAFQMPGLDRFVGDQAKQALIQELGNKMAGWAAEGLHSLMKPGTNDQGSKTLNLKEAFSKNPELSKQLKREIQNRLRAWLPKMARKALYKGLLQKEIVGDENLAEFKEIEQEVIKVLNTTFNEQTEQWMGGWDGSFKGERFLANQIGDAIGSATVKGIQNNILKGLGGELPDEALKYLRMGPEKFQEYAEKYKRYLPAAQFAKIKDKVMGIHIVDLPNQVYGGILAASATMHFAKAFAGMKINLYELKRAKEVTETLVWQLRNKESVSLNLGDFVGMLKMLGDQLGGFQWGSLKKIAKWNPANQFMAKLDWFEGQLKKIDQLYDQATGKVLEGFDKAMDEIEGELKKLSSELLAPLKIPLHNCIVAEGCSDIFPQLPDWMNKTPLDYLKDFYEDSGLKKDLEETNRKISSALAATAVAVTDVLHTTGPLAEILDIEKIPAKNPSQDSDFDPVFLHNGEFYYTATDVTVPSKGFPFQFTRIYRSASQFLGVLGYNWTHNFEEKLLSWESPEGPGFTYVNPDGKKYFFRKEDLYQTQDGFSIQSEDGTEHLFNKEGVLQAIRDKNGNQLTCFYNDQGQLIKVEDTLGRPYQFFYRPDGLMERLEDFSGRTWRFDYNRGAELIGATSPGTPSFPKGKKTGYRYLDHRMTLIMDPKGQVYLQNFYGRDGKVMAQKYGDENTSIEARYDGLNTWVKDRREVIHLYEHDEEGHLLQHNILKQDGNLKKIPMKEAPKGEAKKTDLGGNQFEHDLWGNIIAMTDPQGNIRRFEVDASNLITKETTNGSDERRYYYDANDNIVRMEVPDRKLKVEFEYDMLDRMVAKREYLSPNHVITTHYEYNPQGRLTRFVYPMGNDIRFIYDDEGNLIKSIRGEGEKCGSCQPLGSVSPNRGPSLPIAAVTPIFPQSTIAYDSLGRPLVINHIQFEWDDNSRLSSITDEKGEKTLYTYDGFNRLILEKFPNGSQITYTYDQEDQLVEMVDRQGNTHQFKYDSEGRLVQRLAGPYEQRFSYDKSGRLMEAFDFNDPKSKSDDVRTQFAYDKFSRLAGEAINGRWVYKSFDEKGRKTGVRFPSKLLVVHQYDDAGNLIQVFAGSQRIANFKYSDEGFPIEREWGNGMKLNQSFDPSLRLLSQVFSSPDQKNLLSWKYSYDTNGRLDAFQYDSKGKLVDESFHGPSEFERDAAGNLVRDNRFLYEYDPFDRLVTIRRLNEDIVVRYFYDVFGRIARKEFSDQKKAIDLIYDDWNEIENYVDGKPYQQIIYGDGLDQPLALKKDGFYFYHLDRLGSVRFLTDQDGKIVESYDYTPFGERTGASHIGNELGFIGRPFEEETGLVNLRHRFYSPVLKEFITPDPLGYKNDFYTTSNIFTPRNFSYHQGQGGASRTAFPNYVEADGGKLLLDIDLFYATASQEAKVPEMNLYSYAGGDPINFYDPLGLYALIMDKHTQKMALFDKAWTPIKTWEARTKGKYSSWQVTDGPTPRGVYKIGETHRYADGNSYSSKKKLSDNQKKFGWGKIDLEPISGDAKMSGRSDFRIHGGGSKLPYPYVPRQGWLNTLGCVRMQNEDIIELIDEINDLKFNGDTEGALEVL